MLHYSKSILVLLALFVSSTLFAQRRSVEEATAIAEQFLRQNLYDAQANTPQMRVVSTKQVTRRMRAQRADMPQSATIDAFYIVNDENNNRFVIVSADERMKTILGYSDNRCFNPEVMPAGLMDMLYSYQQELDAVNNHPQASSFRQSASQTSSASIAAITPLIQTQWGQSAPFNDDCPTYDIQGDTSVTTQTAATGCVATAMAQVINYYRYPTNGIGQYSYQTDTRKIAQSFDFTQLNMDYDKLLAIYDGTTCTDEQKAEVAKLMHACGVSVSMDYGDDESNQSGAVAADIPYALIHHFGYNENINYKSRANYSAEEWDEMIMNDLQAGHPILYAGSGTGGHQFILDGCDSIGLYHFNFGTTADLLGTILSGIGDGYYSLDAVKPTWLGLELADYSFNQSMICNITPSTWGVHEDNFICSTFSIKTSSAAIGGTVPMTCYSICESSDATYRGHEDAKFNGSVGIGVFDTAFNYITSLYSEQKTCRIGNLWLITSKSISLPLEVFENGQQYFIAPYAIAQYADQPTRMRSQNGTQDYYLATVKNNRITFDLKGIPGDIIAPDTTNVDIINDVAGELPSKIDAASKLTMSSLSIAGLLNGTDIKFLNEMMSDGNLTHLDISKCSIVSGGEPYYVGTLSSYNTKDDEISPYMFNSNNVQTLLLPETAKKMSMFCIVLCNSLSSIKTPDACTEVEMFAFMLCSSLENIHITSNVYSFDETNGSLSSLKTITVDEDNLFYKSIDGVLYNRYGSKLIRCPEGLTATQFTVPSSVTEIGEDAFYNCSRISSFQLPESLRYIRKSAFRNSKISSIDIPENVFKIEERAFSDCANLTSFTFPKSITTIPAEVLSGCKRLKEITIQASYLSKIESEAFAGCTSLNHIISSVLYPNLITMPDASGSYTQFDKISSTCLWNVPEGSAQKYIQCPWWVSTWRINDGTNGVENAEISETTHVEWKGGNLLITSDTENFVEIVSVAGIVVYSAKILPSEWINIQLPAGIYIINGKKYVLK